MQAAAFASLLLSESRSLWAAPVPGVAWSAALKCSVYPHPCSCCVLYALVAGPHACRGLSQICRWVWEQMQ